MFSSAKIFQRLNTKGVFINKSTSNFTKSFFSSTTSSGNKNYSSSNKGFRFNSNNSNNNNSNNNNRFKVPFIVGSSSAFLSIIGGVSSSVVSCETVTEVTKNVVIPEEEYQEINKVKRKNQVQAVAGLTSLGGTLGYCAGLATKKIGTFVLFIVGSIFIAIQILSYKGYLNVNWDKVNTQHSPKFTKEKRQKFYRTFYKLLTHNLPFKVGFGGGFVLGFKHG
ncbi:hypothetical protein DICPUDRAFT_92918 [Dictyostelium purpureum]|uniref:FUN14 family protein n=1 Tax=Dictyostelium purpureum TaxID=5786 RepID=F0ZZ80_DICPU|nr:uncharacterized protein DICPUDRAFT_92918 [Dictyostelium purpureum]EGC30739.1 hypothetical protein DICPUDRAFT_92918 [Dictyostelium purpureum]|eukprot:XP_003292723.1 hypothetical protein DICPUDRAFT_92918 [Dictyostelium purpureum]